MACESTVFILFLLSAPGFLACASHTVLTLPCFLHFTLPFRDSNELCGASAKLAFPGNRTASLEVKTLEPGWLAPFPQSDLPILLGLGVSDLYGVGVSGSGNRLKTERRSWPIIKDKSLFFLFTLFLSIQNLRTSKLWYGGSGDHDMLCKKRIRKGCGSLVESLILLSQVKVILREGDIWETS